MVSDINWILKSILKQGFTSCYVSFRNKLGKRWIMPQRNMITAMNLYQPSSTKGKLVKHFLPYLSQFEFIRTCLKIEQNRYELCDELANLFFTIFNCNNIEFSLFCGTPSAHQKITMQIFNKKNILGYCKISNRIELIDLFKHEESLLQELAGKGVDGIPRCMYNGTLSNGVSVFLLSTSKTSLSKVVHSLSSLHWNFLARLNAKTKSYISFEETDFYHSIKLLKQNLNYLPAKTKDIISDAIENTENIYGGTQVEFSVYHADFVPWNMFVEKDELFVFDWEYAGRTFPPFLDAFHFFTQTLVCGHHKNDESIYQIYKYSKRDFAQFVKNPDFTYLCYLLSILSIYISREKENVTPEIKESINSWIRIVKKLLDKT